MVGQAQRLRVPLTRRQRRSLAAAGAALLAALVALVAYTTLSGGEGLVSGDGCVALTVAGPTGGVELRECGASAKQWCRQESERHGVVAALAEPRCRVAGYPFTRTRPPAQRTAQPS